MTRDQIREVAITPEMLAIAHDDEVFFSGNHGQKTRALSTDRDFVGSLAHQTAEIIFDTHQVPYTSYRTDRKPYGQRDVCDIAYEQDKIDVKGHKQRFNEDYFFNLDCEVFDAQMREAPDLNRPEHKTWTELITHVLFVQIEPTFDYGYVLGIITVGQYKKLAAPITLHDKSGREFTVNTVKSRCLQDITKYIYRARSL